MKIALFGQAYKTESLDYAVNLLDLLAKKSCEVVIFEEIFPFVKEQLTTSYPTFNSYEELLSLKVTCMISVGGDGTILQAAQILRDSAIPVIGINTGRLGFLATVPKEEIKKAVDQLLKGKYGIVKRSLLSIKNTQDSTDVNYALNEISVSHKNTTTMIAIDTYLDGEFLNTYWADGLIIATPTGSTGYSLSCNGPIISPQVPALAITAISPHSLSIRPLLINDNTRIKLRVGSREKHFLLSMDSRVISVDVSTELEVQKADFQLYMIELEGQSFFKTLREKLLWGMDKRNY